jgi:mRNA-degrading endonuclease toxin of MazEF toxin-antitoxin module
VKGGKRMIPEQGDIVFIENISGPLLVVSKNFFNKSEQVIVCPIVEDTSRDPLHIDITSEEIKGTVMCEQVKLMDLRFRGYKKVCRIKYEDIINITDAIQAIFDY